jgi:hypothetical protein
MDVTLSEFGGEVLVAAGARSLLLVERGRCLRSRGDVTESLGPLGFDELDGMCANGERLILTSAERACKEVRTLAEPVRPVAPEAFRSKELSVADRTVFVQSRPERAVCSARDGAILNTRPYGRVPFLATDARLVYVRVAVQATPTRTLVECLSPDLELVWRREFDRHFQGSRSHAPVPYNDCVIVVLGWDSETRRSGEIASLRKKDGEITWSRVFEGHPSTCELIGDRLYIEEAGRLWVLDASSGETIASGDLGFPFAAPCLLWTEGTRLFAFSGRLVRVFSMDGRELLQEWALPFPYEFKLDLPIVADRAFYVRAPADSGRRLVGSSTAVVRFSTDSRVAPTTSGLRTTIPADQWPVEVHVYALKSGKATRYHVTVRGRRAENVVRFAYIVIRWVAQARGASMFNDHRYEKTFDGTVLFSWATDDGQDLAVTQMIEELQSDLDDAPLLDTQVRIRTEPMPTEAPGEEEPIGALVTPMMTLALGRVERGPSAVYFLCRDAMERWQSALVSFELADKALKRLTRMSQGGTPRLLKELSRYFATRETREWFDSNTRGRTTAELRKVANESAVWCYANIGQVFYSEADCQNWFKSLSKLARAICKTAREDDEAILEVYKIVDGLAEMGRAEFEARKAAGEFSYVPPWDARR